MLRDEAVRHVGQNRQEAGGCLNAHPPLARELPETPDQHLEPEGLDPGESRQVQHELPRPGRGLGENRQRSTGRGTVNLALKPQDVPAVPLGALNA